MTLRAYVEDGIGHLVLDRPDQLNALTVEIVTALGPEAQRLLGAGARAIVLSGAGTAFCAGADLGIVKAALEGDAHVALTPLVAGLHTSLKQLRSLACPIVAAVDGPAVGAGMGLALSADFRVMGARARLVPGYVGIGSSPDGGVSYLLARALGATRATRALLLNEAITADAALTLGLADEVVDEGTALAAASAFATRLATLPPLALTRVRTLVDAAATQGFADHLDLEQTLVSELWETRDFREGVSAFLERRQPAFTGD